MFFYLNELGTNYKNLKLGNVDVDEMENFVTELGVTAVPSFYAYKDGELVAQLIGDSKEKLDSFCNKFN
jgi:thioredoxin 1